MTDLNITEGDVLKDAHGTAWEVEHRGPDPERFGERVRLIEAGGSRTKDLSLSEVQRLLKRLGWERA